MNFIKEAKKQRKIKKIYFVTKEDLSIAEEEVTKDSEIGRCISNFEKEGFAQGMERYKKIEMRDTLIATGVTFAVIGGLSLISKIKEKKKKKAEKIFVE